MDLPDPGHIALGAPYVVLDLETTGTDPFIHDITEIAAVFVDAEGVVEGEFECFIHPDNINLVRADSTALRMTGFYRRHPQLHSAVDGSEAPKEPPQVLTLTTAMQQLMPALSERHLVGMVPSFDAAFLSVSAHAVGLKNAWHYHLVDVEAMLVGYLRDRDPRLVLPWKSDQISKELGVDPENFDRHTAMGDVEWTLEILAAMGMGS